MDWTRTILRRFRGALGNALVWAAAWFGASVVLVIGLYLLGNHEWQTFFRDLVRYSSEMSAIGFVTGGVFSLYLAGAYRHERVAELSVVQFTLGAGIVTLLVSIALIGGITVFQGWGWEAFRLDKLFIPVLLPAAILGGITGFGSLRLAKRAERLISAAQGPPSQIDRPHHRRTARCFPSAGSRV
jgi:MFS family permease